MGKGLAQAIFEQTFSLMIPQDFSNLVHSTHTYLHMKMEQAECSEMSAYKVQMLGNYPEESIQHAELGGSLKLRIMTCLLLAMTIKGNLNPQRN